MATASEIGNLFIGGANLYEQDQQLKLQRAAALRAQQGFDLEQQIRQQELLDRRRAAEDLLASHEADQTILDYLMKDAAPATTPGPRPIAMDPNAGVELGPEAAMQQGAIDATAGLPGDQFAGLTGAVVSRASPHIQALVTRAKGQRGALIAARQNAAMNYQAMKAQGVHRYAPTDMWDEWMTLGVPIDINDMPPEIRNRAIDKEENRKRALIDLMTIHQAGDGVGPMEDNPQLRIRLMSEPADILERFHWPEFVRNKRAAEMAQFAARNGVDPQAASMLGGDYVQNRMIAADKANPKTFDQDVQDYMVRNPKKTRAEAEAFIRQRARGYANQDGDGVSDGAIRIAADIDRLSKAIDTASSDAEAASLTKIRDQLMPLYAQEVSKRYGIAETTKADAESLAAPIVMNGKQTTLGAVTGGKPVDLRALWDQAVQEFTAQNGRPPINKDRDALKAIHDRLIERQKSSKEK